MDQAFLQFMADQIRARIAEERNAPNRASNQDSSGPRTTCAEHSARQAALVPEAVKAAGPDSYELADLKAMLKTGNPQSVQILLDAGFVVTDEVITSIISSSWCELLLTTLVENCDLDRFDFDPRLVGCSSEPTLMELIEAGLQPTARVLHKMAKRKMFATAALILSRTPRLGLARHKGTPVWFRLGYDFAKKFIPIADLHQSTETNGMNYLMHKLNERQRGAIDLPLSADAAVGFDPNLRVEFGEHTLSPLAIAMSNSDLFTQIADVKRLLAAGADPLMPLSKGRTPIYYLRNGNLEAIRMLVAAGVNLADRDTVGDTPYVFIAANRDHPFPYSRRTEAGMGLLEEMKPDDFTARDVKKVIAAGHRELCAHLLAWLSRERRDFVRAINFGDDQKIVDQMFAVIDS